MLNNLLYLDPAATTAIVTSISAIAAAVGATFIIRWRKIKKGVTKTLKIDENAHKEVEDELVITDADFAGEEKAENDAAGDNSEENKNNG